MKTEVPFKHGKGTVITPAGLGHGQQASKILLAANCIENGQFCHFLSDTETELPRAKFCLALGLDEDTEFGLGRESSSEMQMPPLAAPGILLAAVYSSVDSA